MQVDTESAKLEFGTPSEAQLSDYMVAMLVELCEMAESQHADFLAYLIRLAAIEAANLRDPSTLKIM